MQVVIRCAIIACMLLAPTRPVVVRWGLRGLAVVLLVVGACG